MLTDGRSRSTMANKKQETPPTTLSAMPLDPSARVLVTGGAGFIGSWLIHELNQRGVDRIVVSDFLGTDEKWRNLVPLRFDDYVDAGDLLPRLKSGELGKFDLVLHMGACSSTTERDAAYLMRNNYGFTRDLAEWSLGGDTRFVYASSAATYGDGRNGMRDSSDLDYLSALRPLNMYGYSKHLFDLHAARAGWLERLSLIHISEPTRLLSISYAVFCLK